MTKLISVIIPTYKRPELLKRTLASTTCSDKECLDIVVLDDDPNMSASSIVQEFENVRYLAKRGEQRGLSNSRNIGINISLGKYLIFIDDDDYFYPSAIDTLKAALQPGISFYYGDFTYVKKNQLQDMDQSGTEKHKLLATNTIPVGSFMIEKSSIVAPFDTMMRSHEDWEFLLKNIDWKYTKYIRQMIVNIDKTETGSESMQNRRRKLFWLDYLSVYSKHPAPELSEARANIVSSFGVDIPSDLLRFDSSH
jgi:glycosyltransferase involved in cell wall biosynthesis